MSHNHNFHLFYTSCINQSITYKKQEFRNNYYLRNSCFLLNINNFYFL
ncbi:hypothetical protein [Anaerocolumna chitinilytica]